MHIKNDVNHTINEDKNESKPVVSYGMNNSDKIESKTSDNISSKSTTNAAPNVEYLYDFSKQYRWIAGIAALLIGFFYGPVFVSFENIAQILDREGMYHELCDGEATFEKDGFITCNARQGRLRLIGSNCTSIFFAFSFVAGIVLDSLGSKLCSLIGGVLCIIGWILVAIQNSHFNSAEVGFYLAASGTDIVFFGFLPISNLFPNYQASYIAMLGTMRSLCFIIPIIFGKLNDAGVSLRVLVLCYLVVLGLLYVGTLFFLPFQSFPRLKRGEKFHYGFENLENETNIKIISLKEYVSRRPNLSCSKLCSGMKKEIKNFGDYALRVSYLALLIVSIVTLVRVTYVQGSLGSHLSPSVTQFYNVMLVVSFVPCPFMGYVADKIGGAAAMTVIGSAGVLSLIFMMMHNVATSYIASAISVILYSFIASEFYCYAAAVYPQSVMGKVAGSALFIGATLSLISGVMVKFAIQGNKELLIMDILVLVLGCISVTCSLFLYVFVELPTRRRKRIFNKEDETNNIEP